MVFSLDGAALHRPLGVVFGAEVDDSSALGWIGIEPSGGTHVGGVNAGDAHEGATVAAILPPKEICAAAGRFTRGQLTRGRAHASGIVLVPDDEEATRLAELAARASGVHVEQILVLSSPCGAPSTQSHAAIDELRVARLIRDAQSTRAGDLARLFASPSHFALASARGIVDGERVSLLGIAAGRPLPRRDDAFLALLLTDATLAPNALEHLLATVAERTFGQVAGLRTPAPRDALLALATGRVGLTPLATDAMGFTTLQVGAVAVAQRLVQSLLERTAPRATLVQITISGAANDDEAARAAEAVAADPETPAAMQFATGDLELTRRLAAVVARAAIAPVKLRASMTRKAGRAALRIDFGIGPATATRWTALAGDATADPRA